MNAIEKPSSLGVSGETSSQTMVELPLFASPELPELVQQFQRAMSGKTAQLEPSPLSPKETSAPTPHPTLAAPLSAGPEAFLPEPPSAWPRGSAPSSETRSELEILSLPDIARDEILPGYSTPVQRGETLVLHREPLSAEFPDAPQEVVASPFRDQNIRTEPEPLRTIPPRETSELEKPEDGTLGAAMLQSILNQSSSAPAAVNAATAPAPRGPSLESVVAETVARVLVSDPLHDGRREVRIEFAKEILPDTEVRLWRQDGRLHVEFISPPAVAERGLQEALPRLSDAIQQHRPEAEPPLVTLRLQSSDAGAHPGDGRSRQRYVPADENEESA